ncbi:MAG: hypothetical protein HOP96_08885 [Sphingomonas sp.]|nr:hypothetical protein [Sphingomonas sp.]
MLSSAQQTRSNRSLGRLTDRRSHVHAGTGVWQVEGMRRRLKQSVRRHLDGIVWRATAVGLLPNLALRPHRFPPAALTIGRAYASGFWRPAEANEWLDIIVALLAWPFGVAIGAFWLTAKNGAAVSRRFGRSRAGQFADQLRLAVSSGLLPGWYYIFELYRPGGMGLARNYITRGETKRGAYRILKQARRSATPLVDKEGFASRCAERQVAALPVLLSVHGGELRGPIESPDDLPAADLFVKPVRGRGGRGAERWDFAGDRTYRREDGQTLTAGQFLERLRALSRWEPFLVQRRAENHPALKDLSNGALNTIRILSCLDELERPEVIAAVFRMAVGSNRTVDNVHAGGLAAAVDLGTGRLMQATNLGVDARLGWLDRHPDTGGRITGRILPMWDEVCDLIERAHRVFGDWVVIGWDVAIMADRPRLVEGNSGPDIDLVQRPLRTPFGSARFGQLLAHHLDRVSSAGARSTSS